MNTLIAKEYSNDTNKIEKSIIVTYDKLQAFCDNSLCKCCVLHYRQTELTKIFSTMFNLLKTFQVGDRNMKRFDSYRKLILFTSKDRQKREMVAKCQFEMKENINEFSMDTCVEYSNEKGKHTHELTSHEDH